MDVGPDSSSQIDMIVQIDVIIIMMIDQRYNNNHIHQPGPGPKARAPAPAPLPTILNPKPVLETRRYASPSRNHMPSRHSRRIKPQCVGNLGDVLREFGRSLFVPKKLVVGSESAAIRLELTLLGNELPPPERLCKCPCALPGAPTSPSTQHEYRPGRILPDLSVVRRSKRFGRLAPTKRGANPPFVDDLDFQPEVLGVEIVSDVEISRLPQMRPVLCSGALANICLPSSLIFLAAA